MPLAHGIPASILEDDSLNTAIATMLPPAYSFEIHKTIHHILTNHSRSVALQMPEGLTLWATAIADILERFTGADMTIMGDVTYGACCVDDYTALALGCDLLVHYGHSCLVPVDQTKIKTLYVFVEISVDSTHLAETVRANFPSDKASFQSRILGADAASTAGAAHLPIEIEHEASHDEKQTSTQKQQQQQTHLVVVGTVQFINAIQGLQDALSEPAPSGFGLAQQTERLLLTESTNESVRSAIGSSSFTPSPSFATGSYQITVPQIKPLSPGEVLGCTSPKLSTTTGIDAILYLGDGRFHLESIMIANPRIPAFRYDPYTKRFMRELYDHKEMREARGEAVRSARMTIASQADAARSSGADAAQSSSSSPMPVWGVVLGTLGRQGSTSVLSHIRSMLSSSGTPMSSVPILLSELSPQKLSLFGPHLSTYVQTSCPRLSIDWGSAFERPLLSPYEAAVALRRTKGWDESVDGLGMARKPLRPALDTPASSSASAAAREREIEGDYPMDFYANNSRGPWTPRHGMNAPKARTGKGVSNLDILRRSRAAARAAAAA